MASISSSSSNLTILQRILIGLLVLTTGVINYQGFRWLGQWQYHNLEGSTGHKLEQFREGMDIGGMDAKRRLANNNNINNGGLRQPNNNTPDAVIPPPKKAPIHKRPSKPLKISKEAVHKHPAAMVDEAPAKEEAEQPTKEETEPAKVDVPADKEDEKPAKEETPSAKEDTPAKEDKQQSTAVDKPADTTATPPDTTTVKTNKDHSKLVVDVLSIGSKFLPELQIAQKETFGSHHNVRLFMGVNENDDIDPTCSTELTTEQIVEVSRFCRKEQPPEEGDHPTRKKVREEMLQTVQYPWLFDIQRHFAVEQKLLEKKNPAGWVCAQKRPIAGLAKLMKYYKRKNIRLPDYLFIIDDDTFINIDNVLTHLLEENPPNQLNAVAGCLYSMRDENMSMPYGGFGTVLSKKSLQHAWRPLQCDSLDRSKTDGRIEKRTTDMPSSVDDFDNFACERMQENRVNELHLFENGMNLIELFESYASHQKFRDVANWSDAGFCFHSDTFLGYLINTYELGRKEPNHKVTKLVPVNHFQTYDDSVFYYGFATGRKEKTGNRCFDIKWNCDVDSHICHYVPPDRMRGIYKRAAMGQTERGVYPEAVEKMREEEAIANRIKVEAQEAEKTQKKLKAKRIAKAKK